MKELIKNYSSTMLFIVLWYLFYVNNSYYNDFLIRDIDFLSNTINTLDIFHIIILFYAIFLIPFYLLEKNQSKARIVLWLIKDKIKKPNKNISKEQKNSILAWIVKLFFLPLMINWLAWNLWFISNKIFYLMGDFWLISENFLYFFNTYLFAIILTSIFIIDLLFFTIWYMFESKFLWNKIKSVEPTIIWWVVTLICYPPFNLSVERLFWWFSSDYPSFENFYVHIGLNIFLLMSFALYTRASVALWFKASNLTNRWIISRWPYKFIRHPAYAAKNLSRLIWALPLIILNIKNIEIVTLFLIIISISVWFYIYYLRAITEEKHLEQDPDYLEYQKKVKYKFIPKVY